MKIAVCSASDDKLVNEYNVEFLQLTDFQDGERLLQAKLPLSELMGTVNSLQPADKDFGFINLPSVPYLPTSVLEHLMKKGKAEQFSQPVINLTDAFRAVVLTILNENCPNKDYYVEVSE